jgi:hypothetical protein
MLNETFTFQVDPCDKIANAVMHLANPGKGMIVRKNSRMRYSLF